MVARNAKCPCGSGKQYKRCCINKPKSAVTQPYTKSATSTDLDKEYTSAFAICKNHPAEEVLKILSLLQLQPQNHGKNIRLEVAVTELVKSMIEIDLPLDLNRLKKDLLNDCPKDYREDPPDNYFTENIVFSNGNNIVYPGIFIDDVEILQGHIFALIGGNNFPSEFVEECKNALILLLNLQTELARKLNHTHRYFEEIQSETLFIPNDDYLLNHKDLFAFSINDIKRICDYYEIPYTTFDRFVFKWQQNKIDIENFDDNPLFSQPFLFIKGKFILTIPTAINHALIQFILEKAKSHNTTTQFVNEFLDSTKAELLSVFGTMGWQPISLNLPAKSEAPEYMMFLESIWKFDEGKFAYIISQAENILTESEKNRIQQKFSDYLNKRIGIVTDLLKKKQQVAEIILITITSKIGLVSPTMLALREAKNVTYLFSVTPVELFAMTKQWKFNSLTLYKYVKYLSLAKQKIKFAPFTSDLALFDYYKHRNESFYHSDEEPYEYILLDFEIAGNVRRSGLAKLDRIGIGYGTPENFGYLQCVRKEAHFPVYVSNEIFYGRLRTCLLLYSCAIWIDTKKRMDFTADSYANAIFYWLHEMHSDLKDYINQLGIIPLTFELGLDEKFYSLSELPDLYVYDNVDHSISYKVDLRTRRILFTIPIEMIQFFSGPTNKGERILISFLLDAIGKIVSSIGGKLITKEEKKRLIDKHIPLGPKKMLLLFTGEKDIKLANVDIPKKRYLAEADISYILENQLSWLSKQVPSKPLISVEEKSNLLNELVGLHYKLVVNKLTLFNKEQLLIGLLRKHESLLQARAFRHISYPARLLCYSTYYDVHEEFSNSENDLIETSLAVRVLIEFVTLHDDTGQKIISEDDMDIMLAHVIQLINYASLSDSIKFGIENPEIARLPSGRLGISNELERTGITKFKDLIYAEEIHSYTEDFKLYFKRKKSERKPTAEQERYTEKLNNAFLEEWGITLGEIDMISHLICSIMITEKTSVKQMLPEEFIDWIIEETNFDRVKVQSYLNRLKFLPRPEPLKPPPGFETWEVYPWRFNRRLSYLLRPILSIEKDGKEHLLLSARHILASSENLISLFFNGVLKIDKNNKKLNQLLAERNKIKGEEYRDDVLNWLKQNTNLKTYEYEIKIKPKGFFKSEQDKGDIDILAIDREKNIVYSIECKNTIQSKLSYDYKIEMDNYLGVEGKEGLIEKHINRHTWLEANIDQVQTKLNLPSAPIIKSLVVTKNILPLKHLKPVTMPIISFFELKTKLFDF